MELIFQVDPELDIPIYQQLVDRVKVSIKKGLLETGRKLPTVQELAEQLAVARGTIKRAYDELERSGWVEKVQGTGTFVCYRPESSKSRKEQAMAAIDGLLDKLEDMGFSAGEVNIFLNLKLRERAEQEALVKVAVLECNPETLSQMAQQLHHIKQVDLYSFLLDDIRQYPYKLDDGFDLIVTTANHSDYLESVLPVNRQIAKVALRLSAHSLAGILKLQQGALVGILGYSRQFCQLLHRTCQTYAQGVALAQPVVFSPELDVDEWLKGKDVILIPQNYEKYFTARAVESIHAFDGERIECFYKMDEGSVLYLEEKIKRILEKKTI